MEDSIMKIEQHSDSEESTEEESLGTFDSYQDNVILGMDSFKKIFHLPYEPVFFYMLLSFGYVSIIFAIYEASLDKYGASNTLMQFNVTETLAVVIYILDIILRLSSSIFHDLQVDPLAISIPLWILVLDFLSLLPIQYLMPLTNMTPLKAKLYSFLLLSRCLRTFRIIHVFHRNHNTIGISKITLQLFEFSFFISIAVMIAFGFSYNHDCLTTSCKEPLSFEDHGLYLLEAISKITCRGYIRHPNELAWMIFYGIAGYIIFCSVVILTTSYITIAFLTYLQYNKSHRYQLQLIHNEIRRFKPSRDLLNRCMNFYDVFCSKRKGYVDRQIFSVLLPQAMYEDICLDVSWITFKHSKLFRDMSLPYLIHISRYVKPKFLLPGEILFDKNTLKTQLVYLVSGVVQVLSEEDGETPILSFSGGTCFGEASLLLNCKSTATVRCKSYCIFQVLEKIDFIKQSKVFISDFRYILKDFNNRIEEAQSNCKLKILVSEVIGIEDKTQDLIIMWLKNTLHRLMVKDGDTSKKHECQNIYLRQQFNPERFVDCLFIADNLDLLAIAERLELITDSVLLKTSCPCIIQPDSIIVKAWEVFIVIVAIIASFLIPYFAFIETHTTLSFVAIVYLITLVWWLDLYFQISVGVKTAHEILADIPSILVHRLGTIGFIFDIISAIPLEVFSCIVLTTVNGQYRAILQLNRIIKLWRIYNLFKKWEDQMNSNIVLVHYCANACCFIYIVYLETCILYATNCFNADCHDELVKHSVYTHLFWDMVEVIQIITGVNMVVMFTNNPIYYNMYIFYILISLVFYIFFYTHIAASQALLGSHRVRVEETYFDMIAIIETNNLGHKYNYRTYKYIQANWELNRGIKLVETKELLSDMPSYLYSELQLSIFGSIISSVPFFRELPEEVISNACRIAEEMLLPPNEMVSQAGNITTNFYIILNGYCKIVSNVSTLMDKTLSPVDSFAVLEACLGVPAVNTIITVTHCRLLAFPQNKLSSMYANHSKYSGEIEEVLNELEVENKLLLMIEKNTQEIKETAQFDDREIENHSFYKFGYNLRVNSPEEYDYYNPFDRLNFFQCIQFFLLRYTIMPQGRFIYYWEIGRCICAILSSMLFPFTSIGTCIDCEWIFLMLLLDIMAWVDIYVKFHICYYNEDGILVTHPLKTSVHYLKNSFILDVLGMFPVHIFFPSSSRSYNKVLALCQLNRTIQMYRYVCFWKVLDAKSFRPSMTKVFMHYFPIALVVCFSAGSIINNVSCRYGDVQPENTAVFTYGVECKKDSWIAESDFHKPLDPSRVQIYSIYFATSVMTATGMAGFTVKEEVTGTLLTVLSLIGFCLSCQVFCTIVAHFTSVESTLLKYQDAMKAIRNFMKQFNVDYDLQQNLIAHFELKWFRKRGKNIHDSLNKFNRSFQYDLLYDVYGIILQEASEFFTGSSVFLRNILVAVAHDVCVHNEALILLNDVIDHMYILLKGRVNVLAADGTKLATLLPGSMFGNLDNCDMSRQTVTIIANGHIEYLVIKTLRFHKILSNYPNLKRKYRILTALHVDYLEGHGRVTMEDDNWSRKTGSVMSGINQIGGNITNPIKAIRLAVFHPANRLIKLWKMFILIVVCYAELFLELYQMATLEFCFFLIMFQYFCDLCFIFNFYIIRHTAYENQIGIIVKDLDLIQKKLKEYKFKYYLLIISSVPLDVIVWFIPMYYWPIIFRPLRINRLFRIIYVIFYYHEQTNKLNINIYLLRLSFAFLSCNFAIHFFTCMLIIISCLDSPNLNPPVNCDRLIMSISERLQQYFKYFFAVVSCFTRSSQDFIYPHSFALTAYFIVLMLITKIISAAIMSYVYCTLQTGYNRQDNFSIHMSKLKDFMHIEGVSLPLVQSVWLYLRLLWQNQRGSTYPRLLAEAPPHLRELVLNSAFSHLINDHFIFSKCHADFNRQVCAHLRQTTYSQDDFVVLKGSLTGNLFFIQSGCVIGVSVNPDGSEEIIKTFNAGDSFGVLQGLYPEKPHSKMYRCTKSTIVISLNYYSWCHLLKFFPASKVMIYKQFNAYYDKHLQGR